RVGFRRVPERRADAGETALIVQHLVANRDPVGLVGAQGVAVPARSLGAALGQRRAHQPGLVEHPEARVLVADPSDRLEQDALAGLGLLSEESRRGAEEALLLAGARDVDLGWLGRPGAD